MSTRCVPTVHVVVGQSPVVRIFPESRSFRQSPLQMFEGDWMLISRKTDEKAPSLCSWNQSEDEDARSRYHPVKCPTFICFGCTVRSRLRLHGVNIGTNEEQR